MKEDSEVTEVKKRPSARFQPPPRPILPLTMVALVALLALGACAGAEPGDVAINAWTRAHGAPTAECENAVRAADVQTMPAAELARVCEADEGQLLGCMYLYDEGRGHIAMAEDATNRNVAHELVHVLFHCAGLGDTAANHDHTDPVWQ